MKAIHIAPVTLPLWWLKVDRWIAEALRRAKADISLEDVRACIEKGTMQLWIAHDGELRGCCVSEVNESVRGRHCNLVAVSGEDFNTWAHLESDVRAWAKENGCKRLTLQGRKGWTRRLGDGWRQASVAMEKEI